MIDPKLLYPEVTHKYPLENGNNPFDLSTQEKYFIYSKGFSYLSNETSFFMYPFNKGYSIIPMGYRNLEVLSRVLIMKSGKRLIEIEEDIKELNVLNPLIFKANNTKNNQTEGMYNI